MSHQRASTETVAAFSAPKDLIEEAGDEAARRKIMKSGFYRYCLAKELGYPEADCQELAMHGALRKSLAESHGRAVSSVEADARKAAADGSAAGLERARAARSSQTGQVGDPNSGKFAQPPGASEAPIRPRKPRARAPE